MMSKLKILGYLSLFCTIFYFCFLHRSRELPNDVLKFGLSVVDEYFDVKLTGYGVYNPGVIAYKEGYLLVHREKANNILDYALLKLRKKRRNVLKITQLDKDFNQIKSSVQIVPKICDGYTKVTDARLFHHNDEIYMIFCDHSNGGSAQHLVKLKETESGWESVNALALSYDGGEEFYKKSYVTRGIEKNWMPFSHDNRLYIVYLWEPEKIILQADLETGICTVASREDSALMDRFSGLRGGAPPIYVKEMDEYIHIYHIAYPGRNSFTNFPKNVYLSGACMFKAHPPFGLTGKSSAPFYDERMFKNKEKIIFATALIDKGDHFLMFYGEDDYRIKVAKINKKKLLSKMIRRDT